MCINNHKKKSYLIKKYLYIFIAVLLIMTLSSMTFINMASAARVIPVSSCCDGGDCCILSDCECPNCEDRGEPGSICGRCGGDLCANCGNCYDCGTSPCPLCRDYCFNCGSFNLCHTCFGCLDCGHNQDPECPECGEEPLLISEADDNIYRELTIEDSPVPLFSAAGFDFFLFAPFGMPSWAILSLLLTLAGIVFSFIVIIRSARQKERENKEFDERTAKLSGVNSLENVQLLSALENEERFIRQRRLWALIALCFLSFSALLLLVLIQDFRGVVVLFDFWVVIHLALFSGILICGKLAFKRYETLNHFQPAPSFS